MGEDIFVNDVSGKWLILNIYKELIQHNTKKNLIKIWADLNRSFLFFQRRHIHGLKTHEMMFNITLL